MYLRLLLVCCCLSSVSVSSCFKVHGYSCNSDYIDTISCLLNFTGDPVGQPHSSYRLKFSPGNASCPLVVMNHSYSCVCKVISHPSIMSSLCEYDIQLCNKSACHLVTETFSPSLNILLKSPYEVEVQEAAGTFNITWKSGYEDHTYLTSLEYEFSLQTTGRKPNWTSSSTKSLTVQRSVLTPNVQYCIKVRSIATRYGNALSTWSLPACWDNKAEEEQEHILVILTKCLGPLCAAAGVLLFVFYSTAVRMKIKTLAYTPSPAPFFQPLFQQHEGNLKEWLSPQGTFVLKFQSENILTADAVMIVPKVITNEPEENQDHHNLPVTQLLFTQCQTSYVGLPGTHETPPPLTTVCPGDTSYTQLPCSEWGVSFGEVDFVSSPPKDFFNISHADSGCNCEELTHSPESSLPASPVEDRPTPFSCSDYCVLNKTADGFAPVLVSREDKLHVQPDSPQHDQS